MVDSELLSLILRAPGSITNWQVLAREISDRLNADLGILALRTPIDEDAGDAVASNGHVSSLDDWVTTLREPAALAELRKSGCEFATARLDHTTDTTDSGSDPATQSWADRNGFHVGMHGLVWRDHARSGLLSVFRRDRRMFTDADEANFRAILVPLADAASAQRRIDRVAGLADVTRSVLNTLFVGAVVTAKDRVFVHANDMALELLEEGDGVRIEDGRFSVAPTVDPKTSAKFSKQMELASNGTSTTRHGATSSMTIARAGRSNLSILSAPLVDRPARHAWHEGYPVAVSYLSVPEKFKELAPERLQAAYGLTPAEADLAIAISIGKSLRQAAVESGRSEATLRKQLQGVFTKTRTHRQSELVSKLLRRIF